MKKDLFGRWLVIESDLGLNIPFCRGQEIPINNCWHFSTDGNSVDILFLSDDDFRNAMNRIFIISRKYRILILAFCIMDTHIHFVLYGDLQECKSFIHEYVKLTSMDISRKYGESHKMKNAGISCQKIDTDIYLRTVICYVIKNPYVAGIAANPWDYQWSSGALYFRRRSVWTTPAFLSDSLQTTDSMKIAEKKREFKTHSTIEDDISLISGLINPVEYVEYELVEKIFKTVKSFNYFLFKTKDIDVESRDGFISRLSVPIQELKQHRDELCMEMFKENNPRRLDTSKRIELARALKFKYNSSPKQIIRLCGLVYDEVSKLI